MSTALSGFLFSLLASLVNGLGIVAAWTMTRWSLHHRHHFVGFSAGLLISIAFVHLIPESFERTSMAAFYLLAGFMTLSLVNGLIMTFFELNPYMPLVSRQLDALEEGDPDSHLVAKRFLTPMVGYLFLLGIGIHSFLDGMIYGVNFSVSIETGMLTALGLILHEFPEGLMTFLILKTCDIPHRQALIGTTVATAITTPLGTLIALPMLDLVTPVVLGCLLSFTSGLLLYIGCSHLLPELEQSTHAHRYVGLVLGIAVGVGLCLLQHPHP